MFIRCNSIGKRGDSQHLSEIFEYCWKLSSFLLTLFYSSMILVHLIASHKRNIKTFDDLANTDVMTTISSGTTMEHKIRVNISTKITLNHNHFSYILFRFN